MKERGSILIYALVALAVVTICGGALYAYNSAIKENAVLSGNLATSQRALSEQLTENFLQRERQAHTDKLLANLQGQRNERDRIEGVINAQLGTVYRENEAARKWRDQPVPADILISLRNSATGGNDKKHQGIPAAKPADSTGNR